MVIAASKLMAYVHSELSDADAVEVANLIEADAGLRAKVSSLGRTSRQVSEHFAAIRRLEREVMLDIAQIQLIRAAAAKTRGSRRWMRIWAAFVFILVLAGAGFFVLQKQMTLREAPAPPDETIAPPPPPTAAINVISKEMAPPQQAAPPPIRVLHVDGVTATKGLNREKIAKYLSGKLNGTENCAPTGLNDLQVQISTSGAGEILSLTTSPRSPGTMSCLKLNLGKNRTIFRSREKRTFVTFRLKVQ